MEKKNAPAAVAPKPVASEPVASEPVTTEPVASEAIAAEPVASEGGASRRDASVNWASLRADGPLHKIGACLLANEEYVKFDGDLLLVLLGGSSGNRHLEEGQPLVYRVDTESRSLHAVNIGSRAFFVSYKRCISVDTRVHPIVRPGCIYYEGGYIR
jgi:hypothetical protein